jgi:hypothetical protein
VNELLTLTTIEELRGALEVNINRKIASECRSVANGRCLNGGAAIRMTFSQPRRLRLGMKKG